MRLLSFSSVLSLLPPPHSVAHAATPSGGPGLGLAYGELNTQGKSSLVQDAAWVQLKLAYKIHRPGYSQSQQPYCAGSCGIPSIYTLSTSVTSNIEEPFQSGTDDRGSGYTDTYMWYLCGPGASTVALAYWNTVNENKGNGYWGDPHAKLWWNTSPHYRPYMMYIAAYSQPHTQSTWLPKGEEVYGAYSSGGGADADTPNANVVNYVNWEASGENISNWQNWFYILVTPSSSLTLSVLISDVQNDVYVGQVPPIVSVNDTNLPDWKNSKYKGGSHDIAIVGYNQVNGTFTYVETCGFSAAGCETSGNGVYTIPESTMLTAINNDNGQGALIW